MAESGSLSVTNNPNGVWDDNPCAFIYNNQAKDASVSVLVIGYIHLMEIVLKLSNIPTDIVCIIG